MARILEPVQEGCTAQYDATPDGVRCTWERLQWRVGDLAGETATAKLADALRAPGLPQSGDLINDHPGAWPQMEVVEVMARLDPDGTAFVVATLETTWPNGRMNTEAKER